jgi:class 3 adenylate cyclase/tetratricopeptide (TPR) repeat protein
LACSNCGAQIAVGVKFCPECGSRQLAACAACGTPLLAGAKFCAECGTATGAAPTATDGMANRRVAGAVVGGPSDRPIEERGGAGAGAPLAVGSGRETNAERRLVSVLFADLVGFTTISEGRDHETVREILTAYFELASGVIERHGGTVEKFIGDAVMAVWGAPIAHEDDAERAVRAALQLVDAVPSLGPGIEARAGVLTGEAAVTIGATNQGMVAGDLVNTASRLQGIAEPGTVVVGESTARAASASIAFEPLGDQQLKGRTAPVPAYRALRVVAERGGRGRSDVLEAPFVGRDTELRLLKELFHSTERESRARLVSIIGPAGIGKSRLGWEFQKYLDGIVGTVLWHQGRAPAYGEGMTFWSLGEMVRSRARLVETDDERTTRRKIAEVLATYVSDESERRWLEPALLALLGIDAGTTGPEQLFAAWRTFFERLAANATVVLVFEDLHWADSGTLDFIDHLLEWSRSTRLFVITLSRPELIGRRPDWGAGKRNFTSLDLEPLSNESMRRLLDGLVPGLPEDAARAIVARADGIPLYAVETIRMLVSDGRVQIEDGRYVPTGDLTSLAIPDTLTALIAARLDGLDPQDRALLQDAAVLGQSFTTAGLAAISDLPKDELDARLQSLVRAEVFSHEVDARSPERGQYAFVQALIREVAYNTLSRKDRKSRHLAAARYFEGLETDELAGALATHFLAARDLADGDEADALGTQARLALKGAADRASALGSHAQAARYLEQALDVARGPLDEAELLRAVGIALTAAGRYDEAITRLRRAVALNIEQGAAGAQVLSTVALARALMSSKKSADALELLGTMVADTGFDAELDPASLARLLISLGGALNRNAEPDRALATFERALPIAERLDLTEQIIEGLGTKGAALATLGRRVEGLGLMQLAGELAETHGFPTLAARNLGNRGAYLLADPRAALEVERAAIELSVRLGQRGLQMTNVQNAAEDALRTGNWDWAVAVLEKNLEEDIDPVDRASLLMAQLRYRAYRGQAADDRLVELAPLVAELNDREMLGSFEGVAGDVAFAAGDPALARQHARAAAVASPLNAPLQYLVAARAAAWLHDPAGVATDLADFAATSVKGGAMDVSRIAAEAAVAAIEGDPDGAHRKFAEALRAARELGLPWDEAMIAIDMAMTLEASDPEVVAAAADARATFERLQARPMIDLLERTLKAGSASGGRRAIPSRLPESHRID